MIPNMNQPSLKELYSNAAAREMKYLELRLEQLLG